MWIKLLCVSFYSNTYSRYCSNKYPICIPLKFSLKICLVLIFLILANRLRTNNILSMKEFDQWHFNYVSRVFYLWILSSLIFIWRILHLYLCYSLFQMEENETKQIGVESGKNARRVNKEDIFNTKKWMLYMS